jgi:hypothetical protein
MLKRCGSIAHHENHVDRRSYEPVAAPRQRIEKETLMRRHRLVIGFFDHQAAQRALLGRVSVFQPTSMSRRTLIRAEMICA